MGGTGCSAGGGQIRTAALSARILRFLNPFPRCILCVGIEPKLKGEADATIQGYRRAAAGRFRDVSFGP